MTQQFSKVLGQLMYVLGWSEGLGPILWTFYDPLSLIGNHHLQVVVDHSQNFSVTELYSYIAFLNFNHDINFTRAFLKRYSMNGVETMKQWQPFVRHHHRCQAPFRLLQNKRDRLRRRTSIGKCPHPEEEFAVLGAVKEDRVGFANPVWLFTAQESFVHEAL